MTGADLYVVSGAALVGLGLHAVVVHAHLLRKIIALNVLAAGVFLLLIAATARSGAADPVAQAMVITGLVVAVSASALAVWLARRLQAEHGRPELPEDPAAGAEDRS